MNTNTKRITHYITALISVVVLVCIDQFTKISCCRTLKRPAGLCTDQKYISIRIS